MSVTIFISFPFRSLSSHNFHRLPLLPHRLIPFIEFIKPSTNAFHVAKTIQMLQLYRLAGLGLPPPLRLRGAPLRGDGARRGDHHALLGAQAAEAMQTQPRSGARLRRQRHVAIRGTRAELHGPLQCLRAGPSVLRGVLHVAE